MISAMKSKDRGIPLKGTGEEKMNYKYLDMQTYKRKEHFDYFRSMAYPYVGITANVDISELLSKIRKGRLPFFSRSVIVYRERQTVSLSSARGSGTA